MAETMTELEKENNELKERVTSLINDNKFCKKEIADLKRRVKDLEVSISHFYSQSS